MNNIKHLKNSKLMSNVIEPKLQVIQSLIIHPKMITCGLATHNNDLIFNIGLKLCVRCSNIGL